MHVVTILGARPQFIKAAPVSAALVKAGISEIYLHTGQHFDHGMSQVFFDELGLKAPEYNLGIHGLTHGAMTGRMLERIEEVLRAESPDAVLVYGDTNSTLAGALAGAKMRVAVAHVEAGLRSYNRQMPEEINRVVTDHVSDLLFAPTATAVANLDAEGIRGPKVVLAGDVMYDAALRFAAMAELKSGVMTELGLEPRRYVLATIHRAENTDDEGRLRRICESLRTVAAAVKVVLPIHPRTRATLLRAGISADGLIVVDPVGYLDMVMLEKNACAVVTDSGGVQKEAFFHGVPCLTVRKETEWTELVAAGWNVLVEPDEIPDAAATAMTRRRIDAPAPALYGDGNASARVADALFRLQGARSTRPE